MSEWNSNVSAAPRDGTKILVYGRPKDEPTGLVRFKQAGIHTAYWDEIDASFCLSGATWEGPFIEPTHWMPLPEPPA